MKPFLFFALLLSSASLQAQSIKETLFSGKLKTDSGTVIRKGDDLSTKIDTSTRRKPVEVPMVKTPVPGNVTLDSLISTPTGETAAGTAAAATNPKDNNAIWKAYMDEFTGILRTDVLPSKKVKSGTYSILIEYEIGLDGQVGVNNVSVSPESSYLQDQVKERLTLGAPALNPVLMTNGKPRKVLKKQMLTLAK